MRTNHFTLPTILPNGSTTPTLAAMYITPAGISVTEAIFPWLPKIVYAYSCTFAFGHFVTNAHLNAAVVPSMENFVAKWQATAKAFFSRASRQWSAATLLHSPHIDA